ncbi:hypothetical protein O159_23160 [Leifsonia xyli subsp. cynodontis DSM 46306]|uniref:Uncharacterized protein n=1 Tax=Leifsonia xyli subsp. cynodontis DSM 46306 TaxID=1389489 RepID=U3PBZ4_LEIXC|nr:hypothetical protein O159_23160 [Leifsonia xyli subsp. cynodontis DSM 46306]
MNPHKFIRETSEKLFTEIVFTKLSGLLAFLHNLLKACRNREDRCAPHIDGFYKVASFEAEGSPHLFAVRVYSPGNSEPSDRIILPVTNNSYGTVLADNRVKTFHHL